MKKYLLLALLLTGILFPFAALVLFSDSYAAGFNAVFSSLASHIIAHALLFAALSACLLAVFARHAKRKRILLSLLVLVCVAVLQETIQALSVGNLRLQDSLLDLAVDLAAGAVPLILYAVFRRQ